MKSNKIKIHNCDICNSAESEDIKVLRKYSGKQSIHVCKNCGFVHVQKRRSTNEIAKTWHIFVVRFCLVFELFQYKLATERAKPNANP